MTVADPLQVLILEDSAPDAEVMVLRLREEGFEPDWQRVTTPAELVSRLTPSVDVVLSDFHVPPYTASDLLRMLYDIKSDVPVIVVSGMLGDEAAVDLLQDGASDYVLKDRMARLGPAVRRAMAERSLKSLRREAEERLRENEGLLLSILHAIEDVVWSMKLPSRELVFVNPAVLTLTGRKPAEFLKNSAIWRDVVHPEDAGAYDQAYAEALRWGFSEADYRILRPDGETRNVRARTWVGFENGAATRAEGIMIDLSKTQRVTASSGNPRAAPKARTDDLGTPKTSAKRGP